MFGKKNTMKEEKKTVKKESTKKEHTPAQTDAFVASIEKAIKKFFNTKEELSTVLIMAGNKKKNIGIGSGDMDKAVALMYDFTKRMGNDYIAALCGMLLRELTEKEVVALAKTLAATSVVSKRSKKSTLH